MPELFYADLNNTLIPIAVDARELVAEWVTDGDDRDYRGRFRQIHVLAFANTDPAFVLRESHHCDGEVSYPIGDRVLSEIEVTECLAGAGIDLAEPLSETVKRAQERAAEEREVVIQSPSVRARGVMVNGSLMIETSEPAAGPCPYRIDGSTLYVRTDQGERAIGITPSESRSLAPLIKACGEWVNMATEPDVPVGTYPNHLGKVICKLCDGELPNHIQRPGGPGKGSKYRISPEPLSPPVPPVKAVMASASSASA